MKRKLYKGIRTNGSVRKNIVERDGEFSGSGKHRYKIIWTCDKHDPKKGEYNPGIDRFKNFCRFCDHKLCPISSPKFSSRRTYNVKKHKQIKRRRRHELKLKVNK